MIVLPLQIAGQKRVLAVAAKVTPTPDALVFSDRTWVYYLEANSSVPRKLAKGNYPALSPDRQRVAYCLPQNSDVSAPAKATVMLFDLSTGKSTVVLQANAWIAHLRWSPNGERISLTLALSSGKRELDTVAPDGTHKQKLITGGEQGTGDIFSPVWAPDGQSIYFQDMNNLVQVRTSGEVLAKTPLGPITEEKEAVTSADSFVPSPTDPNLMAYTRSVRARHSSRRHLASQTPRCFSMTCAQNHVSGSPRPMCWRWTPSGRAMADLSTSPATGIAKDAPAIRSRSIASLATEPD
jgi:Tol biopolymer transport system component